MLLTRYRLLLCAVALAASMPQIALAGAAPTGDPKPLLIILLDTSGSMEWGAGNALTASAELALPNCDAQTGTDAIAAKVYTKSRLITAQEVLTGTFEDYWCRADNRNINYTGEMDAGYGIPHSDACSGPDSNVAGDVANCVTPRQKDNGLLDLRFSDFKFALATFHPYRASDSVFSNVFKYGPDRAGGLNLGIRNEDWGTPNIADAFDASTGVFTNNSAARDTENIGRLIMPPVDDSLGAQTLFNTAAQREILRLRGFSATPLGPMLEDTRELLLNHPNTQQQSGGAAGGGDPFYDCRRRIVILITDGKSNPPEGSHGYSDSVTALWALKNTPPSPVSVYVVGYNLADADLSILQELDPDNGGPADAMFIADSASELSAALAQITSAELQGRQSRATTVYTNATRSSDDMQYQFNAAYDADPNYAINQIGFLNQLVYRCNTTCADPADATVTGRSCVQDLYELHTALNSRSKPRDIMFHIDGALVDLKVTPPQQRGAYHW